MIPFLVSTLLLSNNIGCLQIPLKLPSIIPSDNQRNDSVVPNSSPLPESTTTATDNIINSTRITTPSQSRFKTSLSGGHSTCFKADILFTSVTSTVQMSLAIDTGSSDTAIPINTLSGNNGNSLSYSVASGTTTTYASYGDRSFWNGVLITNVNVSIPSSSVNSRAPFYGILSQSTNPIFVDGTKFNGLMGIAFPALSKNKANSPATVIDAWYQRGVIPNNIVSFHGCPYSRESEAWIDFGNNTPYTDCGAVQATVKVPRASYFNLNITDVTINGSSIPLQSDFQSNSQLSVLDSCTSSILVPTYIYEFLRDQMVGYFGLSLDLQSSDAFDRFMNGEIWLELDESAFIWEKLPNISVTLASGFEEFSTVTLVIGPRQYIQADPTGRLWNFMVSPQNDTSPFMILGLPYFSAFHIILDRERQEITFSPGCGCQTTDKYPLILTDNQYQYCKKSISNTTVTVSATSTSTAWTCQTYSAWLPATTVATASTADNNSNGASSLQLSNSLLLLLLYNIAAIALA